MLGDGRGRGAVGAGAVGDEAAQLVSSNRQHNSERMSGACHQAREPSVANS